MARALLLGLAALLAIQAAAQTTPPDTLPPLVFDDLSYAAAEWVSLEDRPLAERSVFGRNPWCTSLACTGTLVSRAWYRYLWGEAGFASEDSLARLEPSLEGSGTLGFALLAGRHAPTWPVQLASGFTARTGVWAARADFSALPAAETVRIMQSFWLLGTTEAVKSPDAGVYRGTAKGRVEVDFELHNWFGFVDGADVTMETGSFENSERGVGTRLRGRPGAPEGSCRIDGEGLASPEACSRFLTAEGVWTTMLFRTDGRTARFELRAVGPGGTLHAVSDEIEGRAPSQRMMTLMSQYSYGPCEAGPCADGPWETDADLRVVFDWVYHTPVPTRPFDAVLADVATIQAARVAGRRIERLRTAPVRLERPYRPGGGWLERVAPPSVRIDGPQLLAPGQAAEYAARLDDVIGTFRLDWSERVVWPDGRAGDWTAPDARPAFRYPTRMPRRAACLDLRVDAVTMQYTLVDTDEGQVVEWVPKTGDARPRDTRRVCHRDAPAALRDASPEGGSGPG